MPSPRAHRAYLVLFFSYRENRHSHRCGGFWGDPTSRRSAAIFWTQGLCLVRGRRGLSCGRRAVPNGPGTSCPPVIRNSSTMLSTNCVLHKLRVMRPLWLLTRYLLRPFGRPEGSARSSLLLDAIG